MIFHGAGKFQLSFNNRPGIRWPKLEAGTLRRSRRHQQGQIFFPPQPFGRCGPSMSETWPGYDTEVWFGGNWIGGACQYCLRPRHEKNYRHDFMPGAQLPTR